MRKLLLILLVTALAYAQPNVVGTYKGEGGGRSQTLVLSSNRNAQLTTTFNSGKAPITQTGTWKLADPVLTLSLTKKNNATYNETIAFQVDGDELVATQYNVKNWGEAGLVVQRWDPNAPPKPVAQKPVIDSLLVSPTRTLKVGEVLTVAITGTPGCQASFDILGGAQDVIMNEVSAGRYQTNLTLTKNMVVSEAVLVARLSKDGLEAQKEATRSITIEPVASTPPPSNPPVGQLSLLPARDSRTFTPRPTIGVTFPGPVNINAYRLWLDGGEVTGYAQMTENFLRYNPQNDLSQGRHTVRLLGPGTDEQWTFVVASAARVTPSPADGSDTTSYRPRIQARFDSPVQTGSVRLYVDDSEVTGSSRVSSYDVSYQPNYDLTPGFHTVRVAARVAGGERLDYQWGFNVGGSSSTPTNMWLQVNYPTTNSRVPQSFVMTGTAPGRAIIDVEGTVAQPIIPGVLGVKSSRVQYSVYSDQNGNWQVPIAFPGSNGAVMDLTVKARDIHDNASNPIRVRYVLQK